ncbi:MAG TPA: SDR family oxidoreductase [Solirubrobacteraceae bacterium]|nr:SDR family oxidoreductase [Solirubrobacteraceae bacterium]
MASSDASAIFAPGILRGRVALVTGGGTGLGKATAHELARCGADIVIAGRRADVLDAAAVEIAAAGPDGTVSAITADVRETADASRLINEVLARHDGLDVLVNNAGGQFFSPAELIAQKGWTAVWRLNVQGTEAMARAAYAAAMGKRGGTIINVTLSPHNGMPGMAHSGAARAAVETLTAVLAREWQADGVAVCAVAAGVYDTEVMVKYPAAVRSGMSRAIPLQRLGRPEEHAWLVALLASPLGRRLSGTTVTLDGARDNWFGPWPPEGLQVDGEVPVEERRPVA